MFAEEILSEIDTTLDQLIRNAETLQGADLHDLSEIEIDAFQKTQESLLHHLMHMDQVYDTKKKSLRIPNRKSASFKIQEKLTHFEKLKDDLNNSIEKSSKKQLILSKRRGKRLLRNLY
jgi:hypothetical protein